jgi:hypothetical protein
MIKQKKVRVSVQIIGPYKLESDGRRIDNIEVAGVSEELNWITFAQSNVGSVYGMGFVWEVSDGFTQEGVYGSHGQKLTHAFLKEGEYNVRVKVQGSIGGAPIDTSVEKAITVNNNSAGKEK